MKPLAHLHAHPAEPHTHTHHAASSTLTQGVAHRLLAVAPALLLLWLLVAWALQ